MSKDQRETATVRDEDVKAFVARLIYRNALVSGLERDAIPDQRILDEKLGDRQQEVLGRGRKYLEAMSQREYKSERVGNTAAALAANTALQAAILHEEYWQKYIQQGFGDERAYEDDRAIVLDLIGGKASRIENAGRAGRPQDSFIR